MTLDDALRTLYVVPGDASSGPLLVVKGDLETHKSRLTPSGKASLQSYLDAGKPYIVVLGLNDNPVSMMLGGDQNREWPMDAVILQHGVNGKAPYERDITRLYWQTMGASQRVTELLPGIPLTGPLEVMSTRPPESEYQKPTTLTATVRLLARWRMSLD